ncbi:DHHW family protein [Marasmitruncus massiliensis]|uniref:DHHW family protein n=1 Tax=Marasmitruncus massiliensis TaxID=1944642 RepID=UPI000C7C860C|nr:DHHW family protein [Marasmitruncus massiliensis]
MQAFKKYSLLLLFSVLLLATSVADMFVNSRQFSEMENRYLTQRPQFSLSQLFRNEYTPKYEAYINDQFVARDSWITLKSVSESALGKIENNGIVYGSNHHMFEDYRSTDERRLEQNINFINAYFEKYLGQSNFTAAIIPSSYAILDSLVPQGLQNVDQNKRIQEINSRVPSGVTVWDLFPAMKGAVQKADAEGIQDPVYYRTDHHWTTFGAYNAYQSFAQARGLKAVDWDSLGPLEHQVPDFYGSYYSKCKLYSAVPDTITYFDIPFQSIVIDGEEKPGLYDSSLWDKRDKHAAFLWGNNGVTVIKSQNNLNAQKGKTTRILLIKDSYGNSFAPFLTYSYDEVYVVDLRSMTEKMSDFMAAHSFDDVLLMYSFMNFASDTNISLLTE